MRTAKPSLGNFLLWFTLFDEESIGCTADLNPPCAEARPHLANPAWTLTEAARIGFSAVEWPKPYRPAKVQLERNFERERQLAAAGAALTPQQVAAKLLEQ